MAVNIGTTSKRYIDNLFIGISNYITCAYDGAKFNTNDIVLMDVNFTTKEHLPQRKLI